MARDSGLDLVEISPTNRPPICKILDFGKYKYAAQKKAAEARKKQKTVEVKMRNEFRFFDDGDKVKVTLRFRGREMAHMNLGMDLLKKVKEDTEEVAKVEAEPKLEGRQMMMVLAPR